MAETVPIFQPFPTEALVGQGKLVLLASVMFCYQRENRMRQSDLRNLHIALSTQSVHLRSGDSLLEAHLNSSVAHVDALTSGP